MSSALLTFGNRWASTADATGSISQNMFVLCPAASSPISNPPIPANRPTADSETPLPSGRLAGTTSTLLGSNNSSCLERVMGNPAGVGCVRLRELFGCISSGECFGNAMASWHRSHRSTSCIVAEWPPNCQRSARRDRFRVLSACRKPGIRMCSCLRYRSGAHSIRHMLDKRRLPSQTLFQEQLPPEEAPPSKNPCTSSSSPQFYSNHHATCSSSVFAAFDPITDVAEAKT